MLSKRRPLGSDGCSRWRAEISAVVASELYRPIACLAFVHFVNS